MNVLSLYASTYTYTTEIEEVRIDVTREASDSSAVMSIISNQGHNRKIALSKEDIEALIDILRRTGNALT